MVECNFVKPGKGNALYKCKLRNLLRGTILDRTYKGGDSLEAADITEIAAQFLYRQGDNFVFMDNESFEQIHLPEDALGDQAKFLLEGMVCDLLFWNQQLIGGTAPSRVILKVEYAEPAARGNTATNVSKPVKLETGAEIPAPAFVNTGDYLRIDTRTGEYIERAKAPEE